MAFNPLQHTLLLYLYTAAYEFSTVENSVAGHQVSPSSVSLPFLPSRLQQTENVFPSMHFLLLGTDRNRMEPDLVSMVDARAQ